MTMINDFLSKISDLFSSEVRFSFLLPLVIGFLLAIGLVAWALGLDIFILLISFWIESPILSSLIAFLGLLILFSLSYFLYGINSITLSFWSGEFFFFYFIFHLNEIRHRDLREALRAKAKNNDGNFWERVKPKFRQSVVAARRSQRGKSIPKRQGAKIHKLLKNLNHATSESSATEWINLLLSYFSLYNDQSTEQLYYDINQILCERSDRQNQDEQWALFKLDQNYGEVIKGTSVGNIVEAYNEYAYKRYGIASQVFWPRLQEVISDKYNESLKAQKAQLDFFTTATTLSFASLLLNLFTPFIFGFYFFYLWGIAYLLLTFILYRATAHAALTYGNTVRSCYDLFRFDLIEKLSLIRPKDSEEERKTWRCFSQLVAFSQTQNLAFAPKTVSDEED